MTYPAANAEEQVQAFLASARDLTLQDLGACPTISGGGSPSMAHAGWTPILTEYRAGTYVYNDRSLIARGACTEADCALTVLATVVSRPTHDRAILDAGSKSLTSDLFGLTGHGLILGYPGAEITALSEVHALFSHYEEFLRQGTLVAGPGIQRWTVDSAAADQVPAYELACDTATLLCDRVHRVLARKHDARDEWIVVAWAASGPERGGGSARPLPARSGARAGAGLALRF